MCQDPAVPHGVELVLFPRKKIDVLSFFLFIFLYRNLLHSVTFLNERGLFDTG